MGKIALDWVAHHAVTYDISKTEVILFSKAWNSKLWKQLSNTPLWLDDQSTFLNKKATQWLEMWLDGPLTFHFHVDDKLRYAKIAKSKIKSLSKIHGLSLTLV